MAVKPKRPKTMAVTIPDDLFHPHSPARQSDMPATSDIVISALCPSCGAPRGAPTAAVLYDPASAHFCCIDSWANPCGHVDTYADVLLEAALQCARFGCVARVCAEFDPHCSAQCVRGDVVARARAARAQAEGTRVAHQLLKARLRAQLDANQVVVGRVLRGDIPAPAGDVWELQARRLLMALAEVQLGLHLR